MNKLFSLVLTLSLSALCVTSAMARGGGGHGGGHAGGGMGAAFHASGGSATPLARHGGGFYRGWGYGGWGHRGYGRGYGYGYSDQPTVVQESEAQKYQRKEDERRRSLPKTAFIKEYNWGNSNTNNNSNPNNNSNNSGSAVAGTNTEKVH